jgi:pyrimidine deaminase RibD-like protein
MALENYLVKPGTLEIFKENILNNHSFNKIYKLKLNDEVIQGIPTQSTESDKFSIKLLDRPGEIYNIPFAEIVEMEPLPENDDNFFMEMAIQESRRCVSEHGRNNPLVGVVLVDDKQFVASAYRSELEPGDHAEYTLLEKKLEKRIFNNPVLYTTLEPCIKRGEDKVPCTDRIIQRRIWKVVIGILDPNPGIRGEGIWRLREAGVEIVLCGKKQMDKIEDINRTFIAEHRKTAKS